MKISLNIPKKGSSDLNYYISNFNGYNWNYLLLIKTKMSLTNKRNDKFSKSKKNKVDLKTPAEISKSDNASDTVG